MVMARVPDNLTIVGLGGFGKNVVFSLSEQEWLLDHFLGKGRSLRLIGIDTDIQEKQRDFNRLNSYIDSISKMKSLKGSDGGDISVHYYCLPDNPVFRTKSTIIDGSSDLSESIDRDNDHSVNNPSDPDPVNAYHSVVNDVCEGKYDFSGGVSRQRAIGKLTLSGVLESDPDFTTAIFAGYGPVAIVAALGGGTGSGMFIDIAREIGSATGRKIWFFGIVPSQEEGEIEQFNAIVALTELEYSNVLGEPIFDHTVLADITPTKYANEYDPSDRIIRNFDASFSYLLLNALALPEEVIGPGVHTLTEYSSIISADAHVLRYPIGSYLELNRRAEELLKSFEALFREYARQFEANNECYTSLSSNMERMETMYREFFVEGENTEDSEGASRYVLHMVEGVFNLLDCECVRHHRYTVLDAISLSFRQMISVEGNEENGSDRYQKLLDTLLSIEEILSAYEDTIISPGEKKILDLIVDIFTHLKLLADIQGKILRIRDTDVRNLLLNGLRGVTGGKESVASLKENIFILQARLEEYEKAIREYTSRQAEFEKQRSDDLSDVELHCRELKESVQAYVSRREVLLEAARKEKDISLRFNELMARLQNRCNRAEEKNAPWIGIDRWIEDADIDSLHSEIESLSNLTGTDLKYLEKVAEMAVHYYYDEYGVRFVRNAGIFSKMLGHLPHPEVLSRERDENLNTIRAIVSVEEDVFQVTEDPFGLVLSPQLVTERLHHELDSAGQEILNSLVFEYHLNDEEREKVYDTLNQGSSMAILVSIRALLDDIMEQRKGYASEIDSCTREIREKTEIYDGLRSQLAFYRDAADLIHLTGNILPISKPDTAHYDESAERYNESYRNVSATQVDPYYSCCGADNHSVLPDLTERSDLGGFDLTEEGREEVLSIVDAVSMKYPDLIDEKILGINGFSYKYAMNLTDNWHMDRRLWHYDRATLVVSSPSAYLLNNVGEKGRDFSKNMTMKLLLERIHDACVVGQNLSHPWETAICFYAASGFLDNLRLFDREGSPWKFYQQNQDMILHHAAFLHAGRYIVRDRVLDPTLAASIADSGGSGEQSGDNDRKNPVLDLYTEKVLN
ncbi:hypothetical protein CUJ86_03570 [Methanofollis fontis]|uniref:Tubulin like n=2 Tax=Methanofollis fontis TaxID=2052832 RepID=A0A483CZY6_9EURY|nr:hypothetical protein CUJ86_03570 [Methanofollis fontis]